MLDITTIILTYNEELHIRRCLENVCSFSKKVYVVDSPSTDGTAEICMEFPNVEVVVHQYPGNQAEQFNWALDSLDIKTEWILRLDADEYLTNELISEMYQKLPLAHEDVSAWVFPLRRVFHGKRLKHGIAHDVKMVRLFRKGCARYEHRLMDEHLKILRGQTLSFKYAFVDDSLISMTAFVKKHNSYSNREAALLLCEEFGLTLGEEEKENHYAENIVAKRKKKAMYAKMPLYWRALGYFIYRHYIKFGFLDGRVGFEWDFFQGLWYRMLIDSKIAEARRLCGKDKEMIIKYIKDVLKVKL